MEDAIATAGLTKGTIEALLGQQRRSLAAQQPCPDCGRLCQLGNEDRPLTVKGGQITLHEPVCHCPGCRRDFVILGAMGCLVSVVTIAALWPKGPPPSFAQSGQPFERHVALRCHAHHVRHRRPTVRPAFVCPCGRQPDLL